MGDTSTFHLSNGLRVVLVTNCLESTTICLRGLAGSNYETNEEIGISHMLEHMSFCGSKKYPDGQLKELVTNVGGKITGTTSRDDVAYLVKVLKKDLGIGLEFLSELFYNLDFDNSSLEKLKNVIKCEINQNREDVRKHIGRISYKILYPNQRFCIYNTGDLNDIDSISIDKLLAFKKRLYFPQNFILTICGNFTISNIQPLVINYFQKQVKYYNVAKTKLAHTQNKRFVTQFEKRNSLELTHLKIDYYGYQASDLFSYNAVISASVLKEMVLYNLNKYTNIAPYILDVASFSTCSYGLFGLYTEIPENELKEFLNIFFYSLNILKNKCVNSKDLNRIKLRVINDFVFSLEKTSLRADHYSELFLYQKNISSHLDEIRLLKNTSAESVTNIFRQLSYQKPKITIIGRSAPYVENIYNRVLVTL